MGPSLHPGGACLLGEPQRVTIIHWMVSDDEEGNMDLMIVTVLAIGTLCWGLRAMQRNRVTAPVRLAQGVSLRRMRTRR